MSGWSYGKFCNGCPNEGTCDWYCPSLPEDCSSCIVYNQGICEGICNNQISNNKRLYRNLKYYIKKIWYWIRNNIIGYW